jgi:hypothetical protein
MKLKLLLALLIAAPNCAFSAENLSLQFTHRFRIETWDNTTSMHDGGTGTSYTRQRSCLGGNWKALPSLELGLKLTHEFRYYMSPTTKPFSRDEVVFDNLYAKWSNEAWKPLTLTVGRQNMTLGEGFVVADGTPLDGSRTSYFNAVRLDVKPCLGLTITGFYLYQDKKDYDLPVFNNQHQALVENRQQASGLYVTRDWEKLNLQGYFINKVDEHTWIADDKVNTYGVRGEFRLGDGWKIVSEDAIQTGKNLDRDIQAYGGYTRIGREMQGEGYSPKKVFIGEIYLSGDKQREGWYEAWDPLFGRWPKWSESYIYTLINDYRVAYWSDILAVYGETAFDLSPETKLQVNYYYLMAPHMATNYHAYGSDRGGLLIMRMDYKINQPLSGCLIWERFVPGDYYAPGSNSYVWMRAELAYRFDWKM